MANIVKFSDGYFYRIKSGHPKTLEKSAYTTGGWQESTYLPADMLDLSVKGDELIIETTSGTFVKKKGGSPRKK